MNLKRGTMFGLDARIALAIFGALSVISGAALYSAIQQSKVTRIIADISEVNKAIEAYMLDTGSDLPVMPPSLDFVVNSYSFVENAASASGWSGPYLPYAKTTGVDSRNKLVHTSYDYVSVELISTDVNPTTSTAVYCTAGKPCYYWSFIFAVPMDIVNAVNELVDGDGTLQDGNVRAWYANASSTTANIAIKGPLKLTQP
jgi:type II secretory pathway pseudopilin PulG